MNHIYLYSREREREIKRERERIEKEKREETIEVCAYTIGYKSLFERELPICKPIIATDTTYTFKTFHYA